MNNILKINDNIKKNIILIISFILLLQPIIDLVIGLSIKTDFFPSIMSLIRMIILGFLLYYFIFINKSKYKKWITIFLCLIIVYLGCYFINMNLSFIELKAAIKIFYFPVMFMILASIFAEEKRFIDIKYFLISLSIYAFIIILGFLTNTAFNSYDVAKTGSSGYFNAANEIGGIISLLLPFAFSYVFNKINIKKIVWLLLIIGSIFILGTKTPFISLIICLCYYIIKLINKKNIIKISLISLLSLILLSLIIIKTPIYENMIIHAEFLGIEEIGDVIEKPELIDHFLLGSRLKFLGGNNNVYMESDVTDKLFGIGYIDDSKLAEMDIYDIFYRQGIVGFILFFGTVLSVLLLNTKKYNKDYILPIILMILVSTFVGHVLTAPAVSTFVALILCGFKREDVV
jgi:hypothetical protein